MSTPEQQIPDLPSSGALIRTLALVSMLSGLLVVLIYEYTKPIIAENKRLAVERAIFKVLPEASTRKTFSVQDGKLSLADDKSTAGELIYAGYDKADKLVGIALEAAAVGYSDTVRILYAYNPATGCVTLFDVLKSTETPGFGDKITTDADFLANFKCLDAKVNSDQSGLANAIKTVRHGTKQHDWEIDAIAGSTITSNAVGRMLNDSGQRLHPAIIKNLKQLQESVPAETTSEVNHDPAQ